MGITSTELELKSNITLGKLETNAEAIKKFVKERLGDFTPEKYEGKPDEAKKDRAVLNAAKDTLNKRRLELERAYMLPFSEFKATITETCRDIECASKKLDEIVKAEEKREAEQKREKIEAYWDGTGFDLVELSKVFNDKWLNKTTKMPAVFKEIDALQKKICDDLKILENFSAEDVGLLKINYLEALDITQAMTKANELKANRDRLAKEKVLREQLEIKAATKEQRKAENEAQKENDLDDLSSLALNQTPTEKRATLCFMAEGTFEQLQAVRRQMTALGIVYHELQEMADGIYSLTL